MWETGSNNSLLLVWIEACRLYTSKHLARGHQKVVGEIVGIPDPLRALIDQATSCRVIGMANDHRKVFRAHKGRHSRFDGVKALLEPSLDGFDVGQTLSLSGKSIDNVIHGPFSIAEVAAKGMTEVVVGHDVAKRVHETLQTAVDKISDALDVVCANCTAGSVAFFGITSV